eukprot:10759972-Karenia_brevis.AAC.1
MDVAGVDNQTETPEEPEKQQENQEYPWYDPWWGWAGDIGAITNPTNLNIVCYKCGGKGHIGANCPNKGKGKGKSGTMVPKVGGKGFGNFPAKSAGK